MTATELDLLFKFIDKACTDEQVKDLLRKKKNDGKKIKIGQGEEIIKNLKDAFSGAVVSLEDLTGLLAAGEENGRQHIFLYRVPLRALSKYAEAPKLIEKLRQELNTEGLALPHFVLLPEERTLSDVRLRLLNDQASAVCKWYSSREFEEEISRKTFNRDGYRIIQRESRIEQVRLVSSARYHPTRGLLEVRVPTGARESRTTCLNERDSILQLLEPIFSIDDVAPLRLLKAMKFLKDKAGVKTAKHRISAAQAADGAATAEFNPAIEGDSLWSSLRHKEAMAHYTDMARLDVNWESPLQKKPRLSGKKKNDQTDEAEKKEIRCQMAVYESHGFRLGSKLAEVEVDFVVNRIWDLSK